MLVCTAEKMFLNKLICLDRSKLVVFRDLILVLNCCSFFPLYWINLWYKCHRVCPLPQLVGWKLWEEVLVSSAFHLDHKLNRPFFFFFFSPFSPFSPLLRLGILFIELHSSIQEYKPLPKIIAKFFRNQAATRKCFK